MPAPDQDRSGWWVEACELHSGWTIGIGEEYEDVDYQDEVESNALCDLLETEVVPLFYQRNATGLPAGWIARMKEAIGPGALGPGALTRVLAGL